MVLKANDRRTSCPCHDEFRGPRSDYVRQDENGRTRTKLEYVTRARMEERRKGGGLTAPKRVRGAPRTQWEENAAIFFFAAGMKKKRVCKEKLTDASI
ncbi:hypothetical protein TNCV_3447181 [Trichonephila clavipes]|nr:hypothetical protein TNCV_3447181 [Trichonephila clavipes]